MGWVFLKCCTSSSSEIAKKLLWIMINSKKINNFWKCQCVTKNWLFSLHGMKKWLKEKSKALKTSIFYWYKLYNLSNANSINKPTKNFKKWPTSVRDIYAYTAFFWYYFQLCYHFRQFFWLFCVNHIRGVWKIEKAK